MRKQTWLFALALTAAQLTFAQMPKGFHWVDMEHDHEMMAKVRGALKGQSYTAIREVGVEDGFALVMITSRENDAPTPDYDSWSIYNISLKTSVPNNIVLGYGVKLLDWIGQGKNELSLTYYDCWECEAATVFTTLRFQSGKGWSSRWADHPDGKPDRPQPGVVVYAAPEEGPDDTQQVFAIIEKDDGSFSAGSWVRGTDDAGHMHDVTQRFSINPQTGRETIDTLTGARALAWDKQLCSPDLAQTVPNTGQNLPMCKALLKKPVAKSTTTR